MKPEQKSLRLLGVTRSKGKMYEYGLPEEHHIAINNDPVKLFFISIALLGDLSAAISRGEKESFLTSELKEHLRFSAYFFDAYLTIHICFFLVPLLIIYVIFPEVRPY